MQGKFLLEGRGDKSRALKCEVCGRKEYWRMERGEFRLTVAGVVKDGKELVACRECGNTEKGFEAWFTLHAPLTEPVELAPYPS